MSACIKNHSIPLAQLEKLTGNTNASNTKIQWNDKLKADFETAKEMLGKLQEVYTPRPTDKLRTFSDYSEENSGYGGIDAAGTPSAPDKTRLPCVRLRSIIKT